MAGVSWTQILGFMQRFSQMPQGSLDASNWTDGIHDSLQSPVVDDCALGVQRQKAELAWVRFWNGNVSNADALGIYCRLMKSPSDIGRRTLRAHCLGSGCALHLFL